RPPDLARHPSDIARLATARPPPRRCRWSGDGSRYWGCRGLRARARTRSHLSRRTRGRARLSRRWSRLGTVERRTRARWVLSTHGACGRRSRSAILRTPRLSRRKTAFRPLRRRRRTAHGPSARFRGRFLAGSELIGGSDPHVRRLLDELAGRARDDLFDAALGCHVEYSLGEFAVEHYGRGNAFPVGE